jgi:hypothetical protein
VVYRLGDAHRLRLILATVRQTVTGPRRPLARTPVPARHLWLQTIGPWTSTSTARSAAAPGADHARGQRAAGDGGRRLPRRLRLPVRATIEGAAAAGLRDRAQQNQRVPGAEPRSGVPVRSATSDTPPGCVAERRLGAVRPTPTDAMCTRLARALREGRDACRWPAASGTEREGGRGVGRGVRRVAVDRPGTDRRPGIV